ncbi:cell division protein FtsQ/DivIB [Yeosuana sp.]|uniref:cell division protein FtsQ/DivIB n=1 Tax=Yeosuana sp. TaxID=2529388 RepID=UPI004055184F|tara:strand:+ start:1704 stop:2396 length:693 start_codon:yes stop_codon:yes gene_type:complete
MMVLLGLVIFLFAFASNRNSVRKVLEVDIQFIGENNLFVTHETVSKLLIQYQHSVKNMAKETLDLNQLEKALNSNLMIKSAQVYVTVNGTVKADIEQKTPIARVNTNESYYIDDEGSYMPLSSNFTARVPLVTGSINKNNLKNIYKVANKIKNDEFLMKNVIEINQDSKQTIYLKLRQCDFTVKLGDVNSLDKKINNLKAFYQKNLHDKTLNNYIKVNLQFDNQVVCTKT